MRTELTSTEAARLAGVSPATFRSYVARGQAPRPRHKAGGVNLWSLTDLAAWRPLDLSPEQARSAHADIAGRYSRGRAWEESTRRSLAQIGLSHRASQSLIDGITPAGLDLQTYRDAQAVLATRRALKRRIAAAADAGPDNAATEPDLLRRASARVAAGDGVFTVLADLTLALVTHGYPERMPPLAYDPGFWSAHDDAVQFLAYLGRMDRVELPRLG